VFGELRLPGRQVLARGVDDGLAESEARGNLEGEASAWRAVDQLIGRRESLGLEAERRTDDTGGRRRICLQRVVVARRDDSGSALAEVIDHRDAQRAAFDWVGP
jgi:hypothetical protein